MPDPSDQRHIDALVTLGEHDAEPQVRLAALEAATHFALEPAAWSRIAAATWRIATALPAGSALRGEALDFAAGLPIRSLREHLRALASDEREPDHAAIAHALDRVADPDRIPALIAGLAQGEYGNYRPLAAMPLEDAGLSPVQLPPPGRGHDDEGVTAFWWALCRARLGDFKPFDALFSNRPARADWRAPGLFWGSPWSAYAEIAAIRPIPARMRRHLLTALEKWGVQDEQRGSDHDRVRALEITVRAATGIADAQGLPLEPARDPGPVTLPEPFNPPASVAVLAQRQLQTPQPGFGAPQSGFDDGQVGWMIAREPAAVFVPALLALDGPGLDTGTRVRLLRLIGLAADAQAGRAGSPWRGAAAGPGDGVAERPTLIDDLPRASARSATTAGLDPDKWAGRTRGFGFSASPDDRALDELLAPSPVRGAPGRTRGAASSGPGAAPDSDLDSDLDADLTTGAVADDISAPGPPEKEARRVNAQLLHDGQPHQYFVAGAHTTVRCWIGLRQAGIPSANAPIQHTELPPEGLELVVELCWTGLRDGQPTCHGNGPAGRIHLPADRAKPTEPCELAIDVPADIDQLAAQIMFRYRGKVFEAVSVSAPVLPAGTADDGLDEPRIDVSFAQREVIQLAERTPVDATLVFGPRHLRLFGGSGGKVFDLGDTAGLQGFLNDNLYLTETNMVRRRARAGIEEGETLLDADDEEVTKFFRLLARHGAALFQQLRRQGFTDPGDRIQVINLDEERVVPLEFIYDRAMPKSTAQLCAGWLAALTGEGSRCAVCDAAGHGASASDTICPLGFWAMRKVVERFDTERLTDLSLPAPQRRSLRAFDAALCASIGTVPERERDLLHAALTARIPRPTIVDDWNQWEHEVAQHNPPLLILLAHHDIDAGLDYLEIGQESFDEDRRWRFRPQLNETLINPAPIDPGPIVLLLGCETEKKVAETGYGSLAAQFKDFHASLVLGTLAKILGRHAAVLAAELVAELASVDTPDADFGTVLRRIRRRLLAHGVLMSFALVAIGDAEWRLPMRQGLAPAPSTPG